MKINSKIAVALTAVALVASACGGSDSGSEKGSTDLKACVQKAEEFRDSKQGETELTVPAAFDDSANAGKSVWVINAARVPFLQKISDGAEKAAKAAGMSARIVYGDGSTASAQSAVEQAIAQKAAAIILVVVDPTTMQRTITKARDAGIVVTDVINRSLGDEFPDGVAGTLALDLKTEMEAAVGWILADSGCESDALMYSPSSLPITAAAAEEVEKVYENLCPSCELEVKDLDYGDFASTLTGEVQTDVRRKPNLTHIFSIVGSTIPYVEAGLRGASSDIKIVTHDGLEDNVASLRAKKGNMGADFAFAPSEAIGWQAIDQVNRLLVGDTATAEVAIPSRLLDETNVGSSEADVWPGFADYESAYTAAWNG